MHRGMGWDFYVSVKRGEDKVLHSYLFYNILHTLFTALQTMGEKNEYFLRAATFFHYAKLCLARLNIHIIVVFVATHSIAFLCHVPKLSYFDPPHDGI
jgi:hypothetical protein